MLKFNPYTFLPSLPIIVTVVDNHGVLECEEIYQINPKHRNNSPGKSQWVIANHEEVGVFGWALEHEYISGGYYWGVYLDRIVCRVLGVTSSGHNTKIARFESSGQPRVWHGYPVDYVDDPQHDCPHRTVLLAWEKLNIITKSQIAKLIGGQGWKE